MSTLKSINVIHPSGTTNNIVNDASGNVTIGAALTAGTVTSPSATTLTIQSAGTTAMTVDTSQNVGIGTTSPSQKLQVQTTGDTIAAITSGNGYSSYIYLGKAAATNAAFITYDSGNNMLFQVNASERMRIDSSGNLLVGTTSASAKFAISSGATASIYATNTNASDFFVANMNQGNSSSTALYVMPMRFGNNTLAGSIYWNGTAVLFQGTSDYRMKKDVSLLTDGLSRINSLKPSSYTWIEQNLPGEGFIAHELQEVIPSAVTGQKDAINEDGTIHPQQVDMSRIVPHLVAAIQELSAKNDALEARLAALEAK